MSIEKIILGFEHHEDGHVISVRFLDSLEVPEEKKQPETTAKPEISTPTSEIQSIEEDFFRDMLSFLDIMPAGAGISSAIGPAGMVSFEENFVKTHSTDSVVHGKWTIYTIPEENTYKTIKRFDRMMRHEKAYQFVPQIALLGLVSRLDAFIGLLYKNLILIQPASIEQSEKEFSAREVLSFGSIEDFKDAILTKETENLLRKSHGEQINSLSKQFSVPLFDNDPVLPIYIELCERRNLFAHTNGIISKQYIEKCKKYKCIDLPEVGETIAVSKEYITQSIKCIIEVGIKLIQVLIRKIAKSDDIAITHFSASLNRMAYDLIVHKHYDVATKLLEFGMIPAMRHPDETIRYMMIINLANCYKIENNDKACEVTLSTVNWKVSDPMYRICVESVRDNLTEVLQLMPIFANHDLINAQSYEEWPVFRTVRNNADFQEKFQEIYGRKLRTVKTEIDIKDTISDE